MLTPNEEKVRGTRKRKEGWGREGGVKEKGKKEEGNKGRGE